MEKISNIFIEFKHFILKRNAIDMAMGIILGVSFGKVISSLVDDIIMPPIGFLIGGVPFSHLKIVLKHAVNVKKKIIEPAVTINYGHFLQTIIDFFIVAFTIFFVMKLIDKILKTNNDTTLDWTDYIKK